MKLNRVLGLSAAAAIMCFASGAAQAACYEERPGPQVMSCANGSSGNSADFTGSCTMVAGPPITVEVDCPGRWVNVVSSQDSHAATCSRAGLSPSNTGGQVCASGERRPTTGENWDGINYRHGTWGIAGSGGTTVQMGSIALHSSCAGGHDSGPCDNVFTDDASWCWIGGQKRDYDSTDKTVAYYCE